MLGRRDEALRWLARAAERGFLDVAFIEQIDPLFAGLRGDPEFVALTGRVRERLARFEEAVG